MQRSSSTAALLLTRSVQSGRYGLDAFWCVFTGENGALDFLGVAKTKRSFQLGPFAPPLFRPAPHSAPLPLPTHVDSAILETVRFVLMANTVDHQAVNFNTVMC